MTEKDFAGIELQDMDKETRKDFEQYCKADAQKQGEKLLNACWDSDEGDLTLEVKDTSNIAKMERFRRTYYWLLKHRNDGAEDGDGSFIVVKYNDHKIRVFLTEEGREQRDEVDQAEKEAA